MSMTDILEQIRELPSGDKRNLVERIWKEFGGELGYIDQDLTPEQAAELDRRAEEALKHPERCQPWNEVREDHQKLLKS